MHYPMRARVLRLCVLGAVLALLAWWIPRHSAGSELLAPATDLDPRGLRTGDVILRRGRDVVSAVVLAADSGGRYSHVGIIVPIGRLMAVAHALPEDAEHPEGRVLVESVGEFLAPERASESAVYRLRERPGNTAVRAAGNALRYAREGRSFDGDFRLETTGRLYCSELVWLAFRETGVDLVDGRFSHLKLPLRRGDFVLPSAFTTSPHLRLVLRKDNES